MRLRVRSCVDLGSVGRAVFLPAAIGGGGFAKRTATTDFFEGIMLGSMKMGAPDWLYPYVDIADVVEGHLLAAESDTSGRFILGNDEALGIIELTKIMHRLDPSIAAAPRLIPDFLLPLMPALDAIGAKFAGTRRGVTSDFVATLRSGVFSVSNRRAKAELGWQPRAPIEQSLRELLRTLRAMRDAEAAPLATSARAVAH